jgi:ribosome-associated toxin RatA of RatAB toxin-antitoxin module
MPIIKRSEEVGYSAAQMYALVDDIAAYADFVPMCVASEVHERTPDEVRASLTLAKSGMEKSFTTLNRLQHGKMIEVRLVDGPFKQLEGFWLFEDLSVGSRVSLNLEFEFSNFMMGMMMGPLFNQVANMLVDAFIERAGVVYGVAVS